MRYILFLSALILFGGFTLSQTKKETAEEYEKYILQLMKTNQLKVKICEQKSYCGGILNGHYINGDSSYVLLSDLMDGENGFVKEFIYLKNNEPILCISERYLLSVVLDKTNSERVSTERFIFDEGKVVEYYKGMNLVRCDTLEGVQRKQEVEACVVKRIGQLPPL